MIKKLKTFITNVSLLGLLALPLLAPASVSAATTGEGQIERGVCGGAQNLQFGQSEDCTDADAETRVNALVTTVINIFSVLVGIVAVIMIVYGGFKYITSGGDSGNISAAKNTILFAIVGLIIVALAQIIVRFVLYRAVTGTTE